MDYAAVRLTGKNSVMDFALWIILAVLVVIYIARLFRKK